LLLLFQNIQKDSDGFWLKEGFLDLAYNRILGSSKELKFPQFDNFYNCTLNSDLSEFQEEILFELVEKKESSEEHLENLLKGLDLKKEENLLINISNAKKKIHSMDDFDLIKKPILTFLNEKTTNEEEEMEALNKMEEQEGKPLLYAFFNVAFSHYDKVFIFERLTKKEQIRISRKGRSH
jgi:hypothetical protein